MSRSLGRWASIFGLSLFAALILGPERGFCATICADASRSYYIAASRWGSGGLPVRPDAEWRFGGGLGYDTSGGVFVNYGSANLTTGLSIHNAPALEEGPLAPHQSALTFNRTTNRLLIDAAAPLDCNGEDYTLLAVVRAPDASLGTSDAIASKKEALGAGYPGWAVRFTGAYWYLYLADGSTEQNNYASVASLYGDWISIAFSFYHGSYCSLYTNGAYSGRISLATLGSLTTGAKLNVGSLGGGGSLFGETIALLQIWDGTALTAAHIAAVQSAQTLSGSAAEPFSSIQAACRCADSGDSILVAPGVYRETIVLVKALDALLGDVSPNQARPMILGAGLPPSAGTIGVAAREKCEIGFLDVRGFSTGVGLLADSTSDEGLYHHLTIDSCLTGVKFYGTCDGDTLANITIDGAGLASGCGVITVASGEAGSAALVWANSIIYGCKTGLSVDAAKFSVEADYNVLYASTSAYSGISPGAHDLALDPNFVGLGANDYSLRCGSKVINQGMLLRNGQPPFESKQWKPDLGAWEFPTGVEPTKNHPWARAAWGGRR